PLLFQRLQIRTEDLVRMLTEAVEVAPSVDAGVVQVVELDADGVVADRLDAHDADMAAAGDDGLLSGAVALDFRRGAFDPAQAGGILELRAVVEIDLQQLLVLLQSDLDRPGRRARGVGPRTHRRISSSVSGRASSASMIGVPSRIG